MTSIAFVYNYIFTYFIILLSVVSEWSQLSAPSYLPACISGKDCSISVIDTKSFKVLRHIKNAHTCPVYSVAFISDRCVASGDDCGLLKVWDLSKKHDDPFFEFQCSEDESTINDIIVGMLFTVSSAVIVDSS